MQDAVTLGLHRSLLSVAGPGAFTRRRGDLSVVVFMLAAVMWPATAAGGQPAGEASVGSLEADFNNDGFIDLAVGVPQEAVGSIQNAGAVNVLYGAAAGLTGTGSQLFTQDSPAVPGAAEEVDIFGTELI